MLAHHLQLQIEEQAKLMAVSKNGTDFVLLNIAEIVTNSKPFYIQSKAHIDLAIIYITNL
jgi:hypothetical protein